MCRILAFVTTAICLLSASQAFAAKPQLSVTFGVAGHQVNVAGSLSQGTVRNAPPPQRWRAVLEEGTSAASG